MQKRILIGITILNLLLSISLNLYSQEKVSLLQCYKEAMENYPLQKQNPLLKKASALKNENLSIGWMPKIDANAQATYQSDVTAFDISLPFPGINLPQKISKDQYKASLDISQALYDGGLISGQKSLETQTLNSDLQEVKVELNKLKTQINQFYFSILLTKESEKILILKFEELNEKIKVIESAVANGAMLESSLDILKSEILKLEQQLFDIKSTRISLLKSLSMLIGRQLDDNAALETPDIKFEGKDVINREEYLYFDMLKFKLDAASKLAAIQNNPKIFAFGQAGYGRPALNMLLNSFQGYYIVGAKFNWNLWDWNKAFKDEQIIEIQKKIVETTREVFDKNLAIALENELSNIEKFGNAIEKDSQIITLMEKITKSSYSQLINGAITATDYLTEFNNETISKLNYETHKIQLLQSKTNYLTLKGNL